EVAGEEDDKRAVAQRAPYSRYKWVGSAQREVGAFAHLPRQQPVQDGEDDREGDAEHAKDMALVPAKRFHHHARGGGRDDSAQNGKRLANPEQAGALVVVEGEFGAQRVVRQVVDRVKYEIEREGDSEPERGLVSGQVLRRTQHLPECKPAQRRPHDEIGAAAAETGAGTVGKPPDDRIAD